MKGDIVVIPFPFSDLSQFKRRPALVVADLAGEDVILCQITSQNIFDEYAISLNLNDFKEGSLTKKSNIRPNRIFTADRNIILYKVGTIKDNKIKEVVNRIIEIIKS